MGRKIVYCATSGWVGKVNEEMDIFLNKYKHKNPTLLSHKIIAEDNSLYASVMLEVDD